jgi:hypothetical protein
MTSDFINVFRTIVKETAIISVNSINRGVFVTGHNTSSQVGIESLNITYIKVKLPYGP